MSIEIKVNAQEVMSTLTNDAVNQIPYALQQALIATGDNFQQAMRERFDAIFSLRRASFIYLQGVKRLSPKPTKKNLTITFGQDPRADFLGKFEEGGEKTPTQGDNIAIPEDVRRTKAEIVPNNLRPKALFAGGASVFEITDPGDPHLAPGIYQRMGRGGRTLRKLYALEPSVPIAATLGFEETAVATVKDRWAINFSEAFQHAMETAK